MPTEKPKSPARPPGQRSRRGQSGAIAESDTRVLSWVSPLVGLKTQMGLIISPERNDYLPRRSSNSFAASEPSALLASTEGLGEGAAGNDAVAVFARVGAVAETSDDEGLLISAGPDGLPPDCVSRVSVISCLSRSI